MSVTRLVAHDAASFDAAIAGAQGASGALLVLFTGSSDASGVSWCPDCNDSKPVLEAALAAASTPVTLITVALPREEYKGNAAHWARCVRKGGAAARRIMRETAESFHSQALARIDWLT